MSVFLPKICRHPISFLFTRPANISKGRLQKLRPFPRSRHPINRRCFSQLAPTKLELDQKFESRSLKEPAQTQTSESSILKRVYDLAQTPTSQLSSASSIPTLPPRVKGYPTPWLSQGGVEAYLLPLCRRHWEVQSKRSENDSTQETAFLVASYTFRSLQAAVQFLNDVAIIADEGEKHHPDHFSISMKTKHPVLSLQMQTHSALKPPVGDSAALKIPGITIRDIRFALLLEHLYTSVYLDDGRAILQPKSVEGDKERETPLLTKVIS